MEPVMYSGLPGENSHRRPPQSLCGPYLNGDIATDPPTALTATATLDSEASSGVVIIAPTALIATATCARCGQGSCNNAHHNRPGLCNSSDFGRSGDVDTRRRREESLGLWRRELRPIRR